jgi:hypothetical protein
LSLSDSAGDSFDPGTSANPLPPSTRMGFSLKGMAARISSRKQAAAYAVCAKVPVNGPFDDWS